MAKRKRRGKPSARRKKASRRGLWLKLLAVASLVAVCCLVYLDAKVRYTFSSRDYAVPARVYGRPLELYEGLSINPRDLERELKQLGYRFVPRADKPGQVSQSGRHYTLLTRGFDFWDGPEQPVRAQLSFGSQGVNRLNTSTGSALVRLEPVKIGGIYPAHNEDRVLVRLGQVPQPLIDMLVVMEDRDFYTHWGVSPTAIARAAWVNLKAGQVRQGGSTLTQQLVKNYYLSRDRSLSRKALEAVMALLLEAHYSKDDILQGYINEIFLGQDGPRAIHGFGLASQYYFNQTLSRLQLHQQALLVALVRGPSYYDPWRHPQRAIERRNLVLDTLYNQGYIDKATAEKAQLMPLEAGDRYETHRRRYPAYLDLVRRQLRQDYREQDLSSEGLSIFTNLDPRIQWGAEEALSTTLQSLEGRYASSGVALSGLEGAAVIAQPETGAVLAVVGGRNPRFAGFNRALDAVRPIGSLVKPAVYLAALESGDYHLATPISDEPLALELPNGDVWEPSNFDKKSHGEVPFFLALAKSYNLATAHLGVALGAEQVVTTLKKLGVEREMPAVPSLVLGSRGLAPLEVAQFYQSMAGNGFYTPLQSIRAVTNDQGERLKRYGIKVEQRVDQNALFLLQNAMLQVTRWGTGKGIRRYLNADFDAAGKTGTSDGQRDSWFAGFTGDLLGVVWVGKDDNSETPLTGASGALPVWGDVFRRFSTQPLLIASPKQVEWHWIDKNTGKKTSSHCEESYELPFYPGKQPTEITPCAKRKSWFERVSR